MNADDEARKWRDIHAQVDRYYAGATTAPRTALRPSPPAATAPQNAMSRSTPTAPVVGPQPKRNRICPACGTANRGDGNKYCSACTKKLKTEMRESGYLPKVPRLVTRRNGSREEKCREPSPWNENAVRALEGD